MNKVPVKYNPVRPSFPLYTKRKISLSNEKHMTLTVVKDVCQTLALLVFYQVSLSFGYSGNVVSTRFDFKSFLKLFKRFDRKVRFGNVHDIVKVPTKLQNLSECNKQNIKNCVTCPEGVEPHLRKLNIWKTFQVS